jgi:hypothetical protein
MLAALADSPASNPQHHPLHHPRRRTQPRPPHMRAANPSTQWKILIVDEDSKKLIDNVVKEDDILNLNITSTPPICRPRRLS